MDTGEEQFEQVHSFKYLGAMVNTDNSIEEEIKENNSRKQGIHCSQKTIYFKTNIPKCQTTTL